MSSVSKPRVRHNRHEQGLNLTLEKLSADFRNIYLGIGNIPSYFLTVTKKTGRFGNNVAEKSYLCTLKAETTL